MVTSSKLAPSFKPASAHTEAHLRICSSPSSTSAWRIDCTSRRMPKAAELMQRSTRTVSDASCLIRSSMSVMPTPGRLSAASSRAYASRRADTAPAVNVAGLQK
jgi:hypothetical protein